MQVRIAIFASQVRRNCFGIFGEFIEDMTELQALTQQIDAIANARRSMFSVLVGLDVRLSIIDREYRVWFTNREPSVTGGRRLCDAGRCFINTPPNTVRALPA